MRPRIKVAIVGCGRVAKHYATLKASGEIGSQIDFTGCFDIVPEKAASFARELGITQHPSIEDLIASAPDLVLVLTPSGTHFTISQTLLDSGLNVLVEKPGALRMDHLEQLDNLARSRKLFLGCVHQNRFNRAVKEAKHLVGSNVLGETLHFAVRLRWSRSQDYYEDDWHGKWSTDGGVLSQQAFHHLDALRFILGEVRFVSSFGEARRHKMEAEDTSVAILKLESGAIGTLEATTTIIDKDLEASIEVFGSLGYLKVGGIAMNTLEDVYGSARGDIQRYLEEHSEEVPTGYGTSHGRLLNNLAMMLTGGSGEHTTWLETQRTMRLIHSIYASQETGELIDLRDGFESNRLGR